MGTIADKLAKLNATKADLKAALAEKGQTVGEVFSAYPAAVRAIDTSTAPEFITITAPEGSGAGRTFFCYDGLHYGEDQVTVPARSCVFFIEDGAAFSGNYIFSGELSEVSASKAVYDLIGNSGFVFCPATSGVLSLIG